MYQNLILLIIPVFILIAVVILFKKSNLLTVVKTKCYDFWQGQGVCSTPFQYRQFLLQIEDGARILDIGCGNGLCLENYENYKLIKDKNLQILGIDIDDQYVQANNERIKRLGLEKNYQCKLKNLFEMKHEFVYDYIIFVESFPVIPEDLMKTMLLYSLKLLSDKGKIIFIHNLLQSSDKLYQLPALMKPYIKYIPLVWVDMGRPILQETFENFLILCDLQFKKQCIVSCTLSDALSSHTSKNKIVMEFSRIFFKYVMKSYEIKQYLYECRKINV